jgi:hypothetical protein
VRGTALAALSVLLFGCSSSSQTAAVSSDTASAGRTGPLISPPPVTPPTPPGNNLPAFVCANASGGAAGTASVTAVRVGQNIGYDRFVLQFDSIVPSYTVKRQSTPKFSQPSGQSITLSGIAGVLVQVHVATEGTTYSGPTDFTQADFPVIKEARLIEDYEGYVAWGLGLGSPACFRAFVLSSPARLVVDFAAPS